MPTSTRIASPPTVAPRTGRTLLDLRALNTFVSVCESGSMALAAQRLGVTQSAVSQAIRVLEADHGVQLFDRDVRPARPTRSGALLLEMAVELLSGARRVSEQLRQSAHQDHAQIRLGCVDSFAATIGPALIRGLAGSARQLQLLSGLTPGLNAQLQNAELDLAVCTEVPVANARLSQRLLFSERWVAVFPPGAAPRSLSQATTLRSVANELPLIRYSQRSVIGQQVERFLRHIGVDAARRFEFDATDALLSLVAAGLGWAVTTPLCLWQSRAWLDQVQVCAIPASHLGQRDFHLLHRDPSWDTTADEVARLTRTVLRRETLPDLRSRVPGLPRDVISFP